MKNLTHVHSNGFSSLAIGSHDVLSICAMNMQSVRGFEYGVIHCRPDQDTNLLCFIQRHLDGFPLSAQELLQLGSIYVNQHRVQNDMAISNHDHVRIHRKPRRFATENHNWQNRILFENDSFIVLNKPTNIPCHPTVDNTEENVLKSLKKSIGKEFYITHRLDIPTQGLLIIAKDKETQTRINFAFSERKIKKTYIAWGLPQNINLGLHEHYMIKSPRAPKTVLDSFAENTELCQLIIKNSRHLNNYLVFEIELLTGRTHQIRAQLSKLGAPILGDSMYGGPAWPDHDGIALWSAKIEIAPEVFDQEFVFKIPEIV